MKLRKIMVSVCLCTAILMNGCGQSEKNTENEIQNTNSSGEEQGIGAAETEASSDIFAMDTYMTVTAYGANAQKAVDEAEAEIERLDALLSTGNTDSEIASLNENKSATFSEDGGYLVERALEINKETDGAFDIAIYPVMDKKHLRSSEYKNTAQDSRGVFLMLR